MKILPVGDELFHADRRTGRQTDRYDEANSLFAILQTRLKYTSLHWSHRQNPIAGRY